MDLREELAELAHNQWAGWMTYMLDKCNELENGDLVIPSGYAKALRNQMITPYSDLSEKEKVLDRNEANRILNVLTSWLERTGWKS